MLKKILAFSLILLILLPACAPKPAWKTHKGKQKLKNYNMHMNDNPKVKKQQIKQMKKKTNAK